ncbi:hypothetical protein [Streptomyces sp. DH12]|uniref:hypothetical protein n=1 Tax=Streptomyces sp. DH12 TaxID=2857010 RepID=UPI001E58004D|nr:hypothetical protein [Streptomyces sp. DH12]
MTTTPDTTPAPAPRAAADPTATVDQALADRCTTHGAYLAGLIAAGMLDTAARPDRLPELLFPDADPALVRAIWDTALPVGYHAGLIAGQPQWTPHTLDRAREHLARAGYAAMAHLTARSANTHRPAAPHPADTTTYRPGGRP